MICPQCGKLIGVNEEKCPFCGAWRPGLFGMAPVLQRLGARLDLITIIVTTCIIVYVLALALQPEAIFQVHGLLGILSPGPRALYQLGMTGGLAWQQGWWWTLLTAMYLHGGLLHIFFNMWWIRSLGPVATQTYGPTRAFVIFNAGGVVGFLASNMITGTPTIGASGSIFGLLAAMIVYGRRRGGSVMTQQLWQWAIILFLFGFFMSRVNNWAHAGGFIGGWVAAQSMGFIDEKRESIAVHILAFALIALTALGFVLSFVNVTRLLMQGH